MSGRTSALAVQDMLDSLQLVVSCVTASVLGVSGGYRPSPTPLSLGFVDRGPARLAGDRPLTLSIDLRYSIIHEVKARAEARWHTNVGAYMYALRTNDQSEIVTWHWHPGIPNTPVEPHLHLGPAAHVGYDALHRAHLPTGVVSVADIVRCAITEFGVEPRRADWQAVIERATSV